MPKILKFFTYLLSSLLTFLFLIILITENTNVVSHLYKEKIVEYIQSESQLRFNFDSLNIRWNGIYPNLIFSKISLYATPDFAIISNNTRPATTRTTISNM